MISDVHRKKLFARARDHSWSENQLRDFLFFNWEIESTKQIPETLLDEILGRLEAGLGGSERN